MKAPELPCGWKVIGCTRTSVGSLVWNLTRSWFTCTVALENLGKVIQVGQAKLAVSPSSTARQRATAIALGEVGSGHLRAKPRPGERIQPEVALEVKERTAGHVAELFDLRGPQ